MVTETTEAAAPVMTEAAVLDQISKLPEELQKQLLQKYADEQAKLIERLTKSVAKAEEQSQEAALAGKQEEFFRAIQATSVAAVAELGIVLPKAGLAFNVKIVPSESGMSPSVSCELVKRARASSGGTGTRAPRGSGATSGGRSSITQIKEIDHFKIDGVAETVKSAADVARALGQFVEGENQGRVVARWALANQTAANEKVIVVMKNGDEEFLGDLVSRVFGKKPEAEAEAEAPAATEAEVPTPPPAV